MSDDKTSDGATRGERVTEERESEPKKKQNVNATSGHLEQPKNQKRRWYDFDNFDKIPKQNNSKNNQNSFVICVFLKEHYFWDIKILNISLEALNKLKGSFLLRQRHRRTTIYFERILNGTGATEQLLQERRKSAIPENHIWTAP